MTKKEKEILADIRNKFTPIVSFFELWKMLDDEDFDEEKKLKIYELIAENEEIAVKSAKKVAELLDKFG